MNSITFLFAHELCRFSTFMVIESMTLDTYAIDTVYKNAQYLDDIDLPQVGRIIKNPNAHNLWVISGSIKMLMAPTMPKLIPKLPTAMPPVRRLKQ